MKIILVVLATSLVCLGIVFSRSHIYKKSELSYGVTFSSRQAKDLGLDPKRVYKDIIDNLKIKRIRIPVYWDQVEISSGESDWKELDWQIGLARENNVSVILALGERVPRWPECFAPVWTKTLSKDEKDEALLSFMQRTIDRFKTYRNIIAWQVENEPFLRFFGECPDPDPDRLDREISLVKNMDDRPVIVTDSGELSVWVQAAKRADIFGTSLYKRTYSKRFQRYVNYPITPSFFRMKKNLISLFAHPQDWIVIELQAEPWGKSAYQNLSQEERNKTMDLEKFRNIVEFARQTGFKEFYLWGVEWWYWEKEKNNDPSILEEAKKLFVN
jgi:hypothetical protein